MKRKGFTLIELLAVIVVLAIIALIATPIVMNVIKDTQKGAAERSTERYVNAVETAIATDRLENDLIADGTYNIVDGQLEGTNLDIEVSGDYPKSGTVAIENGQVVSVGTSMTIGNYTVTIDATGKATAEEKGDALVLCTATAPTEQGIFDESKDEMIPTVVGIQATESAPYALGAEYTCNLGDGARTFYVLKEDGNNVKLIMNENLGSYNGMSEGEENTNWPATVNVYLSNQTSGWTTLASVGGTVELPSGQDLADALGDTEWNESSEPTGTYGPDWMKTNLNQHEHSGYWTSTPYSENSLEVWYMIVWGSLQTYEVNSGSGVRPVITISKDNMSL